MPYPIEKKLVVGISSRALFNLEAENEVYEKEGVDSYIKYQKEKIDEILDKGIAFNFIKKFLNINNVYKNEQMVEVVLLSKNSGITGIRIFNSIREYGLDISRGCFTAGDSAFKYIPSFNVSLFLSSNFDDVKSAIDQNLPAGYVLPTPIESDEDFEESPLKLAFDFDGVIVDDEAEKEYKKENQLEMFHEHEEIHVNKPLNDGILSDFFRKISYFQSIESKKKKNDRKYNKILKTSIVTARNAPSHKRAINTLNSWNIEVDEMFFLGGIEKKRILEQLKPDIFFDDQKNHFSKELKNIAQVHIPFGIANQS